MHVVMHVHHLTKVWDQIRGLWKCKQGQKVHTCLHATLRRGWADMERWVDMHTCTDACTPPDQSVNHIGGGWNMHIGLHFVYTYIKGVVQTLQVGQHV